MQTVKSGVDRRELAISAKARMRPTSISGPPVAMTLTGLGAISISSWIAGHRELTRRKSSSDIGGNERRRRNGKVERPGGFEAGQRLSRRIGSLLDPDEDTINVISRWYSASVSFRKRSNRCCANTAEQSAPRRRRGCWVPHSLGRFWTVNGAGENANAIHAFLVLGGLVRKLAIPAPASWLERYVWLINETASA
jgi:hypothetical protein